MIMFMQKGQVTHIVNVEAIYCIICILNDHVYVIHCQYFSITLYERSIISSCVCQRDK